MSALTQTQLNKSKKISIIGAGGFSIWFLTCTPQPLYTVFIANYLTNSPTALGILVAALHLASVFQVFAVLISRTILNQKWLWFTTSLLQRTSTLSLAVVAFLARRTEMREELYAMLLVSLILGSIIAQLGTPCWWSWMDRIIPRKTQGSFFAKRAYFSSIVNAVWMLSASFLLDTAEGAAIYTVYGILFLIGSLMGITETILHIFIPDPKDKAQEAVPATRNILSPLRDKNYVRFLLSTAFIMIAINIAGPFIAPYLTDPNQLNIPKKWIGIQFSVRQAFWIFTLPLWGLCMDRFGKKPVVIIGTLFFLNWITYFFLHHGNYPLILVLSGAIAGLFGPALLEGMGPWMLAVSPEAKKLEYSALFWGVFGVSTALGSFMGGFLFRIATSVHIRIFGVNVHGLALLISSSFIFIFLAILLMSSVKEQKSKSVAYLFSRISNPGVFRAYMNIGIMRKSASSQKVARTLRNFDNTLTSTMAFEDIIERIDDPDPVVREEVIRMLGRNRVAQAVNLLLAKLRNKESSMREEAVKALGAIGNPSVCPVLQDIATSKEYSGLRIAALHALATIGCPDSLHIILQVLHSTRNIRIRTAAAIAGTMMQSYVAARSLVDILIEKTYIPHINEIGTYLGSMIGSYRYFYRLLAGSSEQRAQRINELYTRTRRTLASHIRRMRSTAHQTLHDMPEYSRILTGIREDIEMNRYHDALEKACILFKTCTHTGMTPTQDEMQSTLHFMDWMVVRLQEVRSKNPHTSFVFTLLIMYFLEAYRKDFPAIHSTG